MLIIQESRHPRLIQVASGLHRSFGWSLIVRVKVDVEKCIMAGECYYNHPELFSMGDDGTPIVLVDETSDEALKKHAREAAEICPTGAIEVFD